MRHKNTKKLPSIANAKRSVGILLLLGLAFAIFLELLTIRDYFISLQSKLLRPALSVVELPASLAVERLNANLSDRSLKGLVLTGYIEKATIYDDYERILDEEVAEFDTNPTAIFFAKILQLPLKETVQLELPINGSYKGKLVVKTNFQEMLIKELQRATIRLIPVVLMHLFIWFIVSNYLSLKIVNTVQNIAKWSREFSMGKTRSFPVDLELKFDEYKKLAKHLKIAFDDRHVAETTLRDQNFIQSRIINAVNSSLGHSNQYVSLYERHGKTIFCNTHLLNNSIIKHIFKRQLSNSSAIVKALELAGHSVDSIFLDKDSEDAVEVMLVKIDNEYWQIQLNSITEDFVFLSASNVTILIKAQNHQLIDRNQKVAQRISELSFIRTQKQLLFIIRQLNEITKLEDLPLRLRSEIEGICLSSHQCLESASIADELNAEEVEPAIKILVKAWLERQAELFTHIYSGHLSLNISADEMISIYVSPFSFSACIFQILDQIIWHPQSYGIVNLDARKTPNFIPNNSTASDFFVCFEFRTTQKSPKPSLYDLTVIEREAWLKRKELRDCALWDVEQFAKQNQGYTKFNETETSQIFELCLPIS